MLILPDVGDQLPYGGKPSEQSVGSLRDAARNAHHVVVDLRDEGISRGAKQLSVGEHADVLGCASDHPQRHAGADRGVDVRVERGVRDVQPHEDLERHRGLRREIGEEQSRVRGPISKVTV